MFLAGERMKQVKGTMNNDEIDFYKPKNLMTYNIF